MSWAAHEFENYFLQKKVGVKASFFGICIGTMLPDVFTKFFVYRSDDAAAFHRGWPGVGPTHSLLFGVVLATIVLAVTRSRAWALGLLIGQWAHVATDIADTAGVMAFFPFSTEPMSISMWKHAAAEGRYGDAAAYYSSLGGVWDLLWLTLTLAFARDALRRDYWRTVVVPADPRVWGWLHRRLKLNEDGLLLLYRGTFFYGLARMIHWFLYARLDAKTPWQPTWGGPAYVQGNDISSTGFVEVMIRSTIGAVLLAGFLVLCWRTFGRRLWARGYDIPIVERGRGLDAVLTRRERPQPS